MEKMYSAKEIKEAIDSADAVNYAALKDSLNEQIMDQAVANILFEAIDTALQNYRKSIKALLDL